MDEYMQMNVVVNEKPLNVAVALFHLSAFTARQQNHCLGCTSTERKLCCIPNCLHDIYVCARLQVKLVQRHRHLHDHNQHLASYNCASNTQQHYKPFSSESCILQHQDHKVHRLVTSVIDPRLTHFMQYWTIRQYAPLIFRLKPTCRTL